MMIYSSVMSIFNSDQRMSGQRNWDSVSGQWAKVDMFRSNVLVVATDVVADAADAADADMLFLI